MCGDNMIKSHIYLAESILKRFSYVDSNGRPTIDYIDLSTHEIKRETVRRFNRTIGYYTFDNEQKLKNYAEDKIGNVIARLERCRLKSEFDIILTEKEQESITKYLHISGLEMILLWNL